ncbi:helix-turn-helix domain-containing protein [Desulfoluna sp.]|uniref:helix-turn-helix domain-containing protein n=1 Tax=Desulfoluna sp. TaxID=2045199 RepID=UPI00261CBC2E|nr:helix-turn-helix domain-containing protein [Desulfoluna sp.]
MSGHNEETQERPHFGEYLRDIRLKKGITIEAVCHETKLSRYMVENIEAGNRSVLPEDVLLKSFLRFVADACGADGDTVVSLYLEAYPPKQERHNFYSPKNRRRNFGLLFLSFCLILFVTGGFFFFFDTL